MLTFCSVLTPFFSDAPHPIPQLIFGFNFKIYPGSAHFLPAPLLPPWSGFQPALPWNSAVASLVSRLSPDPSCLSPTQWPEGSFKHIHQIRLVLCSKSWAASYVTQYLSPYSGLQGPVSPGPFSASSPLSPCSLGS